MTGKTPTLPPYPASRGPNIAKQLISATERFRAQLNRIEVELRAAEEAFVDGFARADSSAVTADRISALAAQTRVRRI